MALGHARNRAVNHAVIRDLELACDHWSLGSEGLKRRSTPTPKLHTFTYEWHHLILVILPRFVILPRCDFRPPAFTSETDCAYDSTHSVTLNIAHLYLCLPMAFTDCANTATLCSGRCNFRPQAFLKMLTMPLTPRTLSHQTSHTIYFYQWLY